MYCQNSSKQGEHNTIIMKLSSNTHIKQVPIKWHAHIQSYRELRRYSYTFNAIQFMQFLSCSFKAYSSGCLLILYISLNILIIYEIILIWQFLSKSYYLPFSN